ncbi:microtubule cross-linking factor 1-like [Motacilla alba alba]|uniref:microtubule cross-linking factor 1-like n=1 Tax=Motacilla alba alba TaxID=1094192 RepID=UPI0018D4F3CC|nr:microtubule cross-linking factor 1-like [Motacilla alba alba]XP_037993875.1 microtubule cross-linking factor 1-like [Motacilla alba alba]XP_037993876.1 microtubule cross-linking factor 1-like [Motacilla alba alba]
MASRLCRARGRRHFVQRAARRPRASGERRHFLPSPGARRQRLRRRGRAGHGEGTGAGDKAPGSGSRSAGAIRAPLGRARAPRGRTARPGTASAVPFPSRPPAALSPAAIRVRLWGRRTLCLKLCLGVLSYEIFRILVYPSWTT